MDKIYVEDEKTVFSAFSNLSEQPESSMLIMDYKTGHIVGMVGGRGEKKDMRGLNRATQTKRQPGSTIKPLAVYDPAIEDGKIISDEKVK